MGEKQVSERFAAVLKKLHMRAIALALLSGACAAFFCVGLILLCLKLTETPFSAGYYVLIGFGAFLIVGGAVYLLLRPNEKRAAKRLDEEYALHEKTQTMLAYRSDEGEMSRLQRQDADEALAAVPTKKIFRKGLLCSLISCVAAFALFITAIALPAKESETGGGEYETTDWQRTALVNLIQTVEKSQTDETFRTGSTQKLNELLTALDDGIKASELKKSVADTVIAVEEYAVAANTYSSLGKAFSLVEEQEFQTLSEGLLTLDQEKFTQSVTAVREAFSLPKDELIGKCDNFASQMRTILGEYQDSENGLLKLFAAFADGVGKTSELYESMYSDSYVQNSLDESFQNLSAGAADEIALQKENARIARLVRSELQRIFSLSDKDFPKAPPEETDKKDDDENKDDEIIHDGGYGNGDIKYGSDDMIFDIEKGFVQYGEVLGEYFAKYSEQIAEGKIPEEYAEIFEAYYAYLFNGTKKPEE